MLERAVMDGKWLGCWSAADAMLCSLCSSCGVVDLGLCRVTSEFSGCETLDDDTPESYMASLEREGSDILQILRQSSIKETQMHLADLPL